MGASRPTTRFEYPCLSPFVLMDSNPSGDPPIKSTLAAKFDRAVGGSFLLKKKAKQGL